MYAFLFIFALSIIGIQWACTAHMTHSKRLMLYFMTAEVSTGYVPIHSFCELEVYVYPFSRDSVNMPGVKECLFELLRFSITFLHRHHLLLRHTVCACMKIRYKIMIPIMMCAPTPLHLTFIIVVLKLKINV